MNITFLNKISSKTLLFGLILLFFLAECGLYKKTDARKVPVNAKDRVQKNIEEGRRIKFGNLGKGGSGSFEFATSNEMWRATVDILDFIPLANADYGGGVIITDWYSDNSDNDSIKIMVQFLSNEIRADGIKVTVYSKICNSSNNNCTTSINNDDIGQELKLAILKKAAELKIFADEKRAEEYRKKNFGKPKVGDIGKGEGAKD